MGAKYAIDRNCEAITGHERFWNGSYGERGLIVLLLTPDNFPSSIVFPNCCDVGMVNNQMAAHMPSAFRFARNRTGGDFVACVFSRSDGFELFGVFAGCEEIKPLFMCALGLVLNSGERC